jgi:hypothetical protein
MEVMTKLSQRIDTQGDTSEIIDLWFTGKGFRVNVFRLRSGPALSRQFGKWDLGMQDVSAEQAAEVYQTSQRIYRPWPKVDEAFEPKLSIRHSD